MSNGVDPKYEYCDRDRDVKRKGRSRYKQNKKKARTHYHESPKRARLSARVPLDALQAVVVPEMIEKERKELTQPKSA